MIAQNCIWNDEIGEWQLRYVPYTGNNMRKLSPSPKKDDAGADGLDLSRVYMSYQQQLPGMVVPGSDGGSGTPKTRGKSGRAKSARPKTGKKKSKVITSEDIIEGLPMEEDELYPIVQNSMSGLKLF